MQWKLFKEVWSLQTRRHDQREQWVEEATERKGGPQSGMFFLKEPNHGEALLLVVSCGQQQQGSQTCDSCRIQLRCYEVPFACLCWSPGVLVTKECHLVQPLLGDHESPLLPSHQCPEGTDVFPLGRYSQPPSLPHGPSQGGKGQLPLQSYPFQNLTR